jgi:hypothetical protein
VIRIAISAEAYGAIASILPPGPNIGPLAIAPNGQYRVWLLRAIVSVRYMSGCGAASF